jgi:hypothetical protein
VAPAQPVEAADISVRVTDTTVISTAGGLGLDAVATIVFELEIANEAAEASHVSCLLTVSDRDQIFPSARTVERRISPRQAVPAGGSRTFLYQGSDLPISLIVTQVQWTDSVACSPVDGPPDDPTPAAAPVLEATLGAAVGDDIVDGVVNDTATLTIGVIVTNDSVRPVVPRCTVTVLPFGAIGESPMATVLGDATLAPGETTEVQVQVAEAPIRLGADDGFTYDARLVCRGVRP